MVFVPEGQYHRSLARSAWDSATQKSRPVGTVLIRAGVRTDSMIGVTKFRIMKTETRRPCRRDTSGIRYARSYRTLRDGSFETLCQALRARLRSVVPPGQR
jgi:hypothetical protein